MPPVRSDLLVIAQLMGAIVGAALTMALLPGTITVVTVLSPMTSTAKGLFLEMFLTAELVFTIIMLAAEKHKSTYIAPMGIGLALFFLS